VSPTIVPRSVVLGVQTAVGLPCARCGQKLERSARDESGTGLRHVSRGLCTACYPAVTRAGELHLYPPLQRNPDDILDEYATQRERMPRASLTVIANVMEIPRSTLSRVLATYADDPRSDHKQRAARRSGRGDADA
jgi:hypothetical protein